MGFIGAGIAATLGSSAVVGGAAVAGVGLAAYGAYNSIEAAKDSKEANAQLVQEQNQQDALRRQAMEATAQASQLKDIREQQRARSLALATATADGASKGSGLQGAYGQIAGTTNTDLLSISQGLEMGRNNFDIVGQMNNTRLSLSNSASNAAIGGALTSLGGSIVSNLGTISRLGGGFGPSYPTSPGPIGGDTYNKNA